MARVLIVDDDDDVLRSVSRHLEEAGYETSCAQDGDTALEVFHACKPDLVILDITFPGETDAPGPPLDGIEVLRALRKTSDVFVLMLTATSANAVKVGVLSMGADDYLTKPFHPEELVARVNAILRRARLAQPEQTLLDFGDLRIDVPGRRVWKLGEPVELTALEFDLLSTLAQQQDRVFSRDQLIDRVWKFDYCGGDRVVDVHIGNLRKKVEKDPSNPRFIVTVRGVGYRFESPQATS